MDLVEDAFAVGGEFDPDGALVLWGARFFDEGFREDEGADELGGGAGGEVESFNDAFHLVVLSVSQEFEDGVFSEVDA